MTVSRRASCRLLSYCFALALPLIAPAGPASAQNMDEKAIIVFDASGSMWGQIEGRSKIEIARQTLDQIVGDLPPHLQLGMIAYGHNRKGDCSDIETLVPIGPAASTGHAIAQSVRRINPKGKTPLSEAVKRAASELRFTEDKATVILVTDGIETCNADPCALANQLEQVGVDFTAHVVGFGLSDEEGRQVACLAENTGGLYLPADNADELADALGKTIAVTPPAPPKPVEPEKKKVKVNFLGTLSLVEGGEPLPEEATNGVSWHIQPLDAQGNPGKKSNISRSHKVAWSGAPGKYRITVEYRFKGQATKDIEVDPYTTINETIALNAARISTSGTLMRDDLGLDWAALKWNFKNIESKKHTSIYGEAADILVPAGSYEVSFGVRGEKAKDSPAKTIALAAGQTKQMDFILPHSKVTLEAIEPGGARNMKIRQKISLMKEDGKAGRMVKYDASAKPLFLRPGKYMATIEIWDGTKRKPVTAPIEVGMGDQQTFTIQLP